MTETAFWILTALASGRRHGYALISEVERLSAGVVVLRVTTLYTSLERLERDGRIPSSGEEVVEGRARRYEIADRGRDELATEADRLAARAAAARASMAAARRGPRTVAGSAAVA